MITIAMADKIRTASNLVIIDAAKLGVLGTGVPYEDRPDPFGTVRERNVGRELITCDLSRLFIKTRMDWQESTSPRC